MAKSEGPDVDRIKQVLADLARSVGVEDLGPELGRAADHPGHGERPRETSEGSARQRLAVAKAWVAAREARDRAFGHDLFFDPAWNMLLDLYVQQQQHADVSVSSLCLASKVPMTTALRWIAMLETRKLIERTSDPYDRRRCLLRLSPFAMETMERVLDRVSMEGKDDAVGLGRLN